MKSKYLTKDYEGFRQMMIDAIPEKCPEWTDLSQSDFGIVLIELFSAGLDILSYYQDRVFAERSLPTAQLRSSVIELCKVLTYDLAEQKPAIFDVEFTKKVEALNSNVVIPKGYKIGTSSVGEKTVLFETAVDLPISAGEATATVNAVHGFTVNKDSTIINEVSENMEVKLKYQDVLSDTIEVLIKYQGVEEQWSVVSDFLSSGSTDKHLTREVDAENYTILQFGNGSSGALPQKGSELVAKYRVGGGTIGNVGINTITEFIDAEIDGIESVTNPTVALQAGTNVESISSAKVNAPKHYRTNERAVTVDDYEYITGRHSDVLKVKAVETFNIDNEIDLYVLLESLEYPVPAQKVTEIEKYVTQFNMANVTPVVKSMEIVPWNLTIVAETYEDKSNAVVKAMIEDLCSSEWSISNMNAGESVTIGQLYKTILAMPEVKPNLSFTEPVAEVTCTSTQILKIGTVSATVTGGRDD